MTPSSSLDPQRMVGIAGWLDWARDVRMSEMTAARMGAGLMTRGRGTADNWQDEHIALLLHADPAGHGPAVARSASGEVLAAAVCDGTIHGFPFSDDGVSVSGGRSASAAVLHAYLRWGQSAPQHLDGVFAFAVWDARDGQLVLGRDRLGVKPLSYFPLSAGVVFASDVATIVEHPLVDAEIDGAGFNALLTQLRSPGHGVLRGIREVRGGHTVAVCQRSRSEQCYWMLEARPHELDQAATIERVRDLLQSSVDRETADIESAVLLSGGLDSSVLTGMVADRTGAAPRTFTVVFGDSAAPVPDRPFAGDVVRMWGCEHEEVAVRPRDLLDRVVGAEVLAGKDPPTPFGDKNITPYLFGRYVAARVPVVLSGEGADALFGGLGGTIDESRRLESFPWIESSRHFGLPYGIGTGLFDQQLLRTVDVDGHLDRVFAEAMAEVPHLRGSTPVERLGRQVGYLTFTRRLEQTVLHSERLSTAAGLQVRFPFVDHRLLSFLYNVPPAMKSFGGRAKSLLRAVGAELVPQSVLTRAKVPYPITYDPDYKSGLLTRLRWLLEDDVAPVRPLVDLAGVRRISDNPALLDRGGWMGRADVEMVLQLDDWMRRLRVRAQI